MGRRDFIDPREPQSVPGFQLVQNPIEFRKPGFKIGVSPATLQDRLLGALTHGKELAINRHKCIVKFGLNLQASFQQQGGRLFTFINQTHPPSSKNGTKRRDRCESLHLHPAASGKNIIPCGIDKSASRFITEVETALLHLGYRSNNSRDIVK